MIRGTECRYTRFRIWCDECKKPLMARGTFRSSGDAERWAKSKGWYVKIISTTNLLSGEGHVCPACHAPAAELRAEKGNKGNSKGNSRGAA